MILGIVALGLAGYGFYMQTRVVSAFSHIFDQTSVVADPATNRMAITQCTTSAGSPTALGTLVNPSDETRSYRFWISFRSADGIDPSPVLTSTGRVAPHAAASWSAYGATSGRPLTGCAFVDDPSSDASSTPIGDVVPATPGS